MYLGYSVSVVYLSGILYLTRDVIVWIGVHY